MENNIFKIAAGLEHRTKLLLLFLFFCFFIPLVVKVPGGLKTKVKNKAGMAIGPVDPWKTSRAKAPS